MNFKQDKGSINLHNHGLYTLSKLGERESG